MIKFNVNFIPRLIGEPSPPVLPGKDARMDGSKQEWPLIKKYCAAWALRYTDCCRSAIIKYQTVRGNEL
jgi:hypothetical protein